MPLTAAKLPATLLRAVRSFADQHDARDDNDGDERDAPAQVPLGVLLGAQSQSLLLLCGLLCAEHELDTVAPLLPGGVSAIGYLTVLPRAADNTTIAEQHAQSRESFVLVFVRDTTTAHLFHTTSESGEPRALALEVVPNLHARDCLADAGFALLRAAVDISGEENVQRWRAQLSSSSSAEDQSDELSELFFRIAGSKSVYDCDGVDVSVVRGSSKSLLSALLGTGSAVQSKQSKSKKSTKKKNSAALDAWNDDAIGSSTKSENEHGGGYIKTLEYGEIADVEVLCSMSPPGGVGAAPTLTISGAGSSAGAESAVELHADVLVLVSTDATISDALGLVREQLLKQLDDLERRVQSGSSRIEAHHFALVGTAFPITLLTAKDADRKQQLESVREALLQPPHQPLFDVELCSLVTNSELLRSADVLFNVHEGIPSSGVANGEQFLVAGFYGYYHYMQQGMNDKGWGCAYRSLQTLASWLQLQHYTSKASLTHEEIQRTLVRIGDKPPSFVGSREWIGSMEVGYVLDELFGVSFRSLSVPSGPSLVEKAQELKHHFETQGTPVMMGGGNLAFTLLGIDYNAATGECAFLILDPHYTGGEDMDVIQTKTLALEGYKAVACGWRRASTFAKSFYNLCLPQRPQTS